MESMRENEMRRGLLAALTAIGAAVCLWGCAARHDLLPRDRDPDELSAAIAQRGRGEAPPGPDPPQGSPVLGNCLEVAGTAAVVCLYLPLYFAYEFAKTRSASGGSLR
jgi:hypothetical protein